MVRHWTGEDSSDPCYHEKRHNDDVYAYLAKHATNLEAEREVMGCRVRHIKELELQRQCIGID